MIEDGEEVLPYLVEADVECFEEDWGLGLLEELVAE